MNSVFPILEKEPFILSQSKKEALFMPEIRKAARWHYKNNREFRNLCDSQRFRPDLGFSLLELPYFPISLFKKFDLLTVPKSQIIKTLYSSSTTGEPSKIMIDKVTADNQIKAINNIMADFFRKERRDFVIFDTEDVVTDKNGELSSRGTAIRGVLTMAKKINFILDRDLNIDIAKVSKVFSSIAADTKVCYFGFTWLVYSICKKNKDNEELRKLFRGVKSQDKLFLHIGGWKKLHDLTVSKEGFTKLIANLMDVEIDRVVDFYGMTEQLGTVYPDCPYGYKHVPLYCELIIRDVANLQPVKDGEAGFIQLVSPIPHSYPGISVLSDDIGRIVGVDDCQCGRKGKYFLFEKRSEVAEIKGCGDTLNI